METPSSAQRPAGGEGAGRAAALLTLLTLLAAVLLLVAGCAGQRRLAPIEAAADSPPSERAVHVVRRGDTLFQIAFRYGLDYRNVAAINGIGPPYTIFPGQRLKLAGTPVSAPRSGDAGSAAARRGSAAGASAAPESARSPRAATPPPRSPVAATSGPVSTWQWPAQGEVVKEFDLSGAVSKGIDIRVGAGAPVSAAAAGRVVYAGTGLRGYGLLIILRHDAHYLSAYGYNSRALVNEGESVRIGQRIAEVERDGDRAGISHFEVRRDGKPIDPRAVLPPRSVQ